MCTDLFQDVQTEGLGTCDICLQGFGVHTLMGMLDYLVHVVRHIVRRDRLEIKFRTEHHQCPHLNVLHYLAR
jgi:hypothetical protein